MKKAYRFNSGVLIVIMGAIVRRLLRFLLSILGFFVVYPIVYLISRKKRKYIPPVRDPLLKISATKLAHMIRHQQVKCEDLIAAYVNRCKEVNPILNAIVEPRYELALQEARNVDLLIRSCNYSVEELEWKFPLLGIPVTVKESIAVAGMSNDAGFVKATKVPAVADAECVAQIRAAGCIPIAVTNTPELCMSWETNNYVTGLTKNPHNTRRTVGGSSGGEAALLSSAASLIGIGSDIAGSLRLPAFYTGIFGHKPTPRVVSTVGHMPGCQMDLWNDFFTLGPMVRYAEDLPLIMKSLSNPKGPAIQYDMVVPMHNIKFYYMENDGTGITSEIGDDVKMAFERLKLYLKRKHNITLVQANMKYMSQSFEPSVLSMLQLNGVDTIFSKPGNPSEWSSVTVQLVKKLFGCSNSMLTCICYGILKKIGDKLPEESYRRAAEVKRLLQNEFRDLLQDNGVCFYPSFPVTATYHHDFYRHLGNYPYLLVYNCIGLPVVNCPIGVTTKGLPVGLQVVANPGCDHLLYSVARDLEEAFGGWTIPPSNHE